MEITIPGVDTEKGLSYYGDELDIYLPILRSFVLNTQAVLDKLHAPSPETMKDYVISVHGLKSTSASIGAEAIKEAASSLEKMARANDFDGVIANNETLIENTKKIMDNISNWLNSYDAQNKKSILKVPDPAVLEKLKWGCENFNMKDIDKAIHELESYSYEQDADFVAWLREKINISEFSEIAEKISNH